MHSIICASSRIDRSLAWAYHQSRNGGRAAAFLKHKLKEGEVTYAELAKRLKKHGYKAETEASVTMKLKRGSFPATWFLACLRHWNWMA